MITAARLASTHKHHGELWATADLDVEVATSVGRGSEPVDESGSECRTYRVEPGMVCLGVDPIPLGRMRRAGQEPVSPLGRRRYAATIVDSLWIVSLMLGKRGSRISIPGVQGGMSA
jgi:hypothetical protein